MPNSEDRGNGDASSSGAATSSVAVSRRRLLSTAATTVLGGSGVARLARASGADGLREDAWVETSVDTDDTGTTDRIFVSVTRPESTAEGERVPVIATATPYNGRQDHGDTTDEMLYDRRIELSASDGPEAVASETGAGGASRHDPGVGRGHRVRDDPSRPRRLERRYLQEGYAVANVSSLGTHESTGCYTAAGPETAAALKAVVDWFNGRATAYDAKRGGDTVAADWTDGTTGMIGTSANGELANAVATTGVDGLEAIVPIAANHGQYSLFRSNGTPISVVPETSERIPDLSSWVEASNLRRPNCETWADRVAARQDHETGDYSDFWHEREFLPEADAVDAAVLLTHTVDDPIVKPNNFADWYHVLADADVPLRLWLHEGGHTTPDSEAWRTLVDRWWEYWLKGVDNGVMDEPPVSVVHGGDSADYATLDTYGSWPVPGTEATTVRLDPDGTTVGSLTVGATDADATAEAFVDDPSELPASLVEADDSDHRLRYQTPPLGAPVHVSGQVVPRLSVSFDDPTVLSVALVEYDATAEIVARGWADPLNRPRYGDYDSPVAYKQSLRESSPIDGGEQVVAEFPLQATDHVFEEGSRIGLVVYASDREFTLHPPGNSTVTLSPPDSAVTLPVVGGRAALTDAFTEEPSDGTATRTDTGTETRTDPGTLTPGSDARETETDSTVTGSETDPAQGDTPGFGIGSTVTTLGAAGYLLARKRSGEESEPRE